MLYAILRMTHANPRYDASLDILLQAEFSVISKAVGLSCALERRDVNSLIVWTFEADATPFQLDALGRLSMLQALFALDDCALTPIRLAPAILCAPQMPSILKYKGKTNESFTRFLINIAAFSCTKEYDQKLSLLDPLCAKGTTLYCALGYGYNSLGIDVDRHEITEAVAFVNGYFRYEKYKHKYTKSSLTRPNGSAVLHTFVTATDAEKYKEDDTICLQLVCSDAKYAPALLGKTKFDMIVADLPYGIAHDNTQSKKGSDTLQLVEKLLPDWKALLNKGGVVALSFNSFTLKREELRSAMKSAKLTPIVGEGYDDMEHWVEQAIMRDVAVARND